MRKAAADPFRENGEPCMDRVATPIGLTEEKGFPVLMTRIALILLTVGVTPVAIVRTR